MLTAWGGYAGGAALLPTTVGGGGLTAGEVHTNILGPLVLPIAALMAVTLLAFFIGEVGYVMAWWVARRAPAT